MKTSLIPVTLITVEDTDMPDTIPRGALERAMLTSGSYLERSGHRFTAHDLWNLANPAMERQVKTEERFLACLSNTCDLKSDLIVLIDLDLGEDLNKAYESFFSTDQLGPYAAGNPRDRAGLAFAFQLLQRMGEEITPFVFVAFCTVTVTEYTILDELRQHPAWSKWASRISYAQSLPRQCRTAEAVSANLQSTIDAFLEGKGYGRKAPDRILTEFEGWFCS